MLTLKDASQLQSTRPVAGSGAGQVCFTPDIDTLVPAVGQTCRPPAPAYQPIR